MGRRSLTGLASPDSAVHSLVAVRANTGTGVRRLPPRRNRRKEMGMPFQFPISIATVLQGIQTQQYVLPAIQRELVWDTEQIARLFDSLLRGYPIGSFLFWKVDAAHSSEFKFYGFMRNYHELTAAHCPVLDLPAAVGTTAILDGQQRLTALNIGLRGSYAARIKWRRAGIAANYPAEHLYLNVCSPALENDMGMEHDLRFFAEPPASNPAAGVHWFPVNRVMDPDLSDAAQIFHYIHGLGLADSKRAFPVIERLRKAVFDDHLINFFEETDQDVDKVLDIFIRVNSGGTVLSYSDLLLSIATAQWTELDARDEVHMLVDELNRAEGRAFAFSKDLVLKAGLVLTEVSDIGFKVKNFNHANMRELEKSWKGIAASLRLAAGLLADFGFSDATLTADSVLIPLAYYVHTRKLGTDYRLAARYDADRAAVRRWVTKTLVKPGVWGSGLDTLLRDLRRVLQEHGSSGFPSSDLEAAMAARGKALSFTEEELNELLDTQYKAKRVFALLALLFPGINTRNIHHIDHVFPKSQFYKKELNKAGVAFAETEEQLQLKVNGLANLQLLEGQINIEKQDVLPLKWATEKYGDQVDVYLLGQELVELPDRLADFPVFYDGRRGRLSKLLRERLGITASLAIASVPTTVPSLGSEG